MKFILHRKNKKYHSELDTMNYKSYQMKFHTHFCDGIYKFMNLYIQNFENNLLFI